MTDTISALDLPFDEAIRFLSGKPVYATDDATLSLDATDGKLKVGTIAGLGDGRTWVSVGA